MAKMALVGTTATMETMATCTRKFSLRGTGRSALETHRVFQVLVQIRTRRRKFEADGECEASSERRTTNIRQCERGYWKLVRCLCTCNIPSETAPLIDSSDALIDEELRGTHRPARRSLHRRLQLSSIPATTLHTSTEHKRAVKQPGHYPTALQLPTSPSPPSPQDASPSKNGRSFDLAHLALPLRRAACTGSYNPPIPGQRPLPLGPHSRPPQAHRRRASASSRIV